MCLTDPDKVQIKIYKRTGKLTASAGVSFNKFIAKVASDMNKPDGIPVPKPKTNEMLIEVGACCIIPDNLMDVTNIPKELAYVRK